MEWVSFWCPRIILRSSLSKDGLVELENVVSLVLEIEKSSVGVLNLLFLLLHLLDTESWWTQGVYEALQGDPSPLVESGDISGGQICVLRLPLFVVLDCSLEQRERGVVSQGLFVTDPFDLKLRNV